MSAVIGPRRRPVTALDLLGDIMVDTGGDVSSMVRGISISMCDEVECMNIECVFSFAAGRC